MKLRSSKVDVLSTVARLSGLKTISALVFLISVGLLTRNFPTDEIGLFFFMTAIVYTLAQIPSGVRTIMSATYS